MFEFTGFRQISQIGFDKYANSAFLLFFLALITISRSAEGTPFDEHIKQRTAQDRDNINPSLSQSLKSIADFGEQMKQRQKRLSYIISEARLNYEIIQRDFRQIHKLKKAISMAKLKNQRIVRQKQLQKIVIQKANNKNGIIQSWNDLTKIQVIDLSASEIGQLPQKFCTLDNIDTLYLDKNRLSELPQKFGSLTSLKILDLYDNNLASLPESFVYLIKLQELLLFNNRLVAFSETLGSLTQLRQLWLNNNKLTHLPSTLCSLVKLETLYLHNNLLTVLPENLGQLTELRLLYLNGNNLKVLPKFLPLLSKLTSISLELDWLPQNEFLQCSQLCQLKNMKIIIWYETISREVRLALIAQALSRNITLEYRKSYDIPII